MGEILDRARLIIRTKLSSRRERSAFKPNRDHLNQTRKIVADLNRVGALNDHQAAGLNDVIDDMTVKAPGVDIDGLTGIGSERIGFAKKVIASTGRPGLIDVDGLAAVEYSHDLAQKAEAQAARPGSQPVVDSGSRTVLRRAVLLGLGGATAGVLGLTVYNAIHSYKETVSFVCTVVPGVVPVVQRTPDGLPALEKAKDILGVDFLGSEAIKKTFGIDLNAEKIPAIPFDQAELERAKSLNQFLILRTDKFSDGSALTILNMQRMVRLRCVGEKRDTITIPQLTDPAYKHVFVDDSPNSRWALVSKGIMLGSESLDYLGQTQALADYLRNEIFSQASLPRVYKEAIDEFESQKPAIARLMVSSRYGMEAASSLSNLRLNWLTRQSPAEVVYDSLVYYQRTAHSLLEGSVPRATNYTMTNGLTDDGKAFVALGDIISPFHLAYPTGWYPATTGRGFFFSRTY